MRSMRDIMALLEGDFPTLNQDEMIGKIMSLMGILSGMEFTFKADWATEAMAKVKEAKLQAEADEAGERLKAETEGETVEEGEDEEADSEDAEEEAEETPSDASSFDAKTSYREAADAIFSEHTHASKILADVVTAERTYKDGKTVDPDNLGQEVEESGYLTVLNAQRDLVAAFEGVTPSKPHTFAAVIDGVDETLKMISQDDSGDNPGFVDSVKAELEYLLPLMRFSLTVR